MEVRGIKNEGMIEGVRDERKGVRKDRKKDGRRI